MISLLTIVPSIVLHTTNKQVVTHFFTCKLETWIISFLRPTLGLQHISGSIEFGTTRGAIHAHLLGILESTAREWVDKLLATYATSVSDALTELDDGIRAMYVEQEGCQDPLDRSGKTPAETMQARIDWCNAVPARKPLIETHNKAFEDAGRTASVAIGDVLNASSTSLAAWARKWMHRSLVAEELKSDEEEPIMEVFEVVSTNP